jgi:hypothetical protein
MEPDKQRRGAREDGVALGDAWWVYADLPKKRRFRELQQAASPSDPAPHMGFRHSLEDEVAGLLASGELQASGIEFRSTGDRIPIPKSYFWNGAKIDFDNDTVASLGRKFGQVMVQGKREPIVENLPEMIAADPQQIVAERKIINEPSVVPDRLANRTVTHAVTSVPPLRSEEASQQLPKESRRGRPSKTDEIEQAIEILIKGGTDLIMMPRPAAYRAVRKCAETNLKANTKIGLSDPVIQRALFRRFGRRR